jgi:molybdopterin adenylyltransferase
MTHPTKDLIPLAIAVLTVSDTRTPETDSSGRYLLDSLEAQGHQCIDRQICADDLYRIRALVAQWIADPAVQVVLITGGTGFAPRDVTARAVQPLLDQEIPGFGELFRQVSAAEIGSSTIQSRWLAGLANRTLIACLPGSTGACRTAWEHILKEQLDSRHKPCNFATQLA